MPGSPSASVVVGAAVVSRGRLLAARRAVPASLSGGWELPGGKVDPGEPPELACVREVREELGCEVAVVRRLPGEQPLADGFVLWVYECRLVAGEPTPHEHDAVRWLLPEELDELRWLAADRPFLSVLRPVLLDGERLPGGNVGGAVRVGQTVRRPGGGWSPAVHGLLGHLAAAGLDAVPRVLGQDERGREVLTYLPGDVLGHHDEHIPDALLVDAMRWLRRYHRVVRAYRPSGTLVWRNDRRPLADGEIVCHHDFAPYNCATVDGRVVGVFDWDMAGPGLPRDDLGFAAWNFVPLYADPPAGLAAQRLQLMSESYGPDDGDRTVPAVGPREILAAVVPRVSSAVAKIRAGQRAGDPGMVNLARVGEPERTETALARLVDRLPAIEAHLP